MGLIEEFFTLDQVRAVALGGSRAVGCEDAASDYDYYIYVSEDIPVTEREKIILPYSSYAEIDNRYWECEDDFKLLDGTVVEIIYRNLDGFSRELEDVVVNGRASGGYSTCMWDCLLHSRILFERDGCLSGLVKRYSIPYPDKLRANILKRNMELLDGRLPSFSDQIRKAIKRGDDISVNHRTTEFISVYFDFLFAYNRQTHPGEKRLISKCRERCDVLPHDFEKNIDLLLNGTKEERLAAIDLIVAGVKELC